MPNGVQGRSRTVLAETEAPVAGLSEREATVGRLLDDDALYEGLVGTVAETEVTVRAVRQSAERLEGVVARLGGPEGRRDAADGRRLRGREPGPERDGGHRLSTEAGSRRSTCSRRPARGAVATVPSWSRATPPAWAPASSTDKSQARAHLVRARTSRAPTADPHR